MYQQNDMYWTLTSLPTRERGLKQVSVQHHYKSTAVAPHAGAWIETNAANVVARLYTVAPHAGAWIETVHHPN